MCLIGESGSGKTLTSLSIINLLPEQLRAQGEILFEGKNMLSLSDKALRHIRGKDIGYAFQDPNEALNPYMSIGSQVTEALQIHTSLSAKARRAKGEALLKSFGVVHPDGSSRYDDRPGQCSGGMKQRVLVASATVCEPKLLIADEPTSALDGETIADCTRFFHSLKQSNAMALLVVTHDLEFAHALADTIGVMHQGRLLEVCDRETFYAGRASHPYSRALLGCTRLEKKNGRYLTMADFELTENHERTHEGA